MSAEHSDYYNLAERIDEAFMEIDSEVCSELRESDEEYIELRLEAMKLADDFPVIPQITEGEYGVSLSAEESKALTQYLKLKMEMENFERKQIYFRGHTDCFHYLKKIGVI